MVKKAYRLSISVFVIISLLSMVVLIPKSVGAEESLQANYGVYTYGQNLSVYLKKNGTVWTSGSNECGQLGDDKARYRENPAQIPEFDGVINIVLDKYYILALKADGTVWGWGGAVSNEKNVVYSAKPLQIKNIDGVEKIYLQDSNYMAIRKDGTVWLFKPYTDELPVQVKGLENIKVLKNGSQVLALSKDGCVWSFKPYSDGSVKKIKGLEGIIALESGPFQDILAVDKDGHVWSFKPSSDDMPQLINELKDITALKSSPYSTEIATSKRKVYDVPAYTLAIDKDGSVWAWGDGEYGQLGDGSYGDLNKETKDNVKTTPVKVNGLKSIKSVYALSDYAAALSEDGNVYTWGANFCGQLGSYTSSFNNFDKPITRDAIKAVPTQVFSSVKLIVAGYGCVYTLNFDGSVWSWGNAGIQIKKVYKETFDNDTLKREYIDDPSDPLTKINTARPYQITDLANIIDIFGSYAVKNDGTLWSCICGRVKQIEGINLLESAATPTPTSTPVPTPTNTPEPKFEITLQINNPHMVSNGIEKDIYSGADTSPVIVDGRTLLPIRALIEELGGTVKWDEKTKGVLINLAKKEISLNINSKKAIVSGEEKDLDVQPMIIKNRTMVPLRFIVENLGFNVQWKEETKKIIISNAK